MGVVHSAGALLVYARQLCKRLRPGLQLEFAEDLIGAAGRASQEFFPSSAANDVQFKSVGFKSALGLHIEELKLAVP